MKLSKHFASGFICVLIALVIRLIAFSSFQDSVLYQTVEGSNHDRAIYSAAAEAASNGNFLPGGALDFLPLYPWLLGLLGVVFGTGPVTAAVFGIACDILTTLLIVLFARRLGAGIYFATIAGLLYAAYPLAVTYSLLTMPNTLNTLGVTAFAYVAHRMISGRANPRGEPQTHDTARWDTSPYLKLFVLGLFAGVLTLGFAGMILIALAVAVLALLKHRSWLAPVFIIVGMAIPVAPVAIHNSRAEGEFVLLTTHGGFNFYMGNHERATGYPLRVMNFRMTAKEMLTDAHNYAQHSTGRSMTRKESSAWWKEQANAYWKKNPVDAVGLTIKKFALFWNHQDMDDLRMIEQLRVLDSFYNRLAFVPFAVFGLLGLIGLFFSRETKTIRTLLLVGMAGVVFFFITARYRLTLVPLMAVLGAAGLTCLLNDFKEGKKLKALAIIPLLVFVFIPFNTRDQRPVDYHNVAIQLIADGQFNKAMGIVNRGLEIDINSGALHATKGNILFAQKDYAAAAESFTFARMLNPGDPRASYNLALSLAKAGDYCAARDALRDSKRDERTESLFRELKAACGKAE